MDCLASGFLNSNLIQFFEVIVKKVHGIIIVVVSTVGNSSNRPG